MAKAIGIPRESNKNTRRVPTMPERAGSITPSF
jgi:hypothetical protein